MKGLLLKDLLCLKKAAAMLLGLVVIYTAIFASSGKAAMVSGMVIIMTTILIINTFAYDEQAKWMNYALSLPVTKGQIVLGKYLLSALFGAAGVLLSLLVSVVMRQFGSETLLGILIIWATALFLSSILLPLLFWFGTQKARILLFLVLLLPTALIAVLGGSGIHLSISEGPVPEALLYLSLPVSLLIFIGSFFLSRRILNRREF